MVQLLVDNGADVNISNTHGGETGNSVTLYCTTLPTRFALKKKKKKTKHSELHYAVRLGRKDLVKILLHAGANINIRENREKKTPYELAIATSQLEIADTLERAKDLYEWLQEQKLDEECYWKFIKEDLFLDALVAASDGGVDALLDSLKIDQMGVRLKLNKSIPVLKGNQPK
jgi:hypothetical protein